jgi:hypothetical protein
MATNRVFLGTSSGVYSLDANYQGGARSVDTDTVLIAQRCANNIVGMDDSAIELTSFEIEAGMTRNIGSPTTAALFPLTVDALDYILRGTGEQFIHVTPANNAIARVFEAGEGGTLSPYGLNLTGTPAAGAITLFIDSPTGKIAIGPLIDQVSVFSTINIDKGTVFIGPSATVTTLNVNGGTVTSRCALTTLNVTGSAKMTIAAGVITTLNVRGNAQVTVTGAGTIGTINAYDAGQVTFDGGGTTAITVTNAYAYGTRWPFTDTQGRVAWGAATLFDTTGVLKLGKNRKLTIASI